MSVEVEPAPDVGDLRALFLSCTLKRSPERSHTEGLAARSMEIMEGGPGRPSTSSGSSTTRCRPASTRT